MWKRIVNLFRMIISIFIEDAENAIPVERRLSLDRQQRGERLKQMADKATNIGQAAEMFVQNLARTRIMAKNLREAARKHLIAAQKAEAAGNMGLRDQEMADAASLSDEIAGADAEVAELEAMVEDGLRNKQAAITMVKNQARQLEKLAGTDARLVARIYMAQMKEESLKLQESLMDLYPEDADNIRQRISKRADEMVAHAKSRSDVIRALSEQKAQMSTERAMQTTAEGQAVLQELQNQVGYTPAEVTEAEAPKKRKASSSS